MSNTLRWNWLTRVVIAILILGPVGTALFQASSYALWGPPDLFTLAYSSWITLLFPLLVAPLGALGMSEETSGRRLAYLCGRASIVKFTMTSAVAASGRAAVACFTSGIVTFLTCFYAAPAFGLVNYYPELLEPSGLTYEEHAATFATWSQLLTYGDWFFGVAFSLWLAANGFLYALISVATVLLVGNRLLAIALPFIAYNLLSALAAMAGVPEYAPGFIFPFNLTQLPIETIVVSSSSAVLVAVSLWLFTWSRPLALQGTT